MSSKKEISSGAEKAEKLTTAAENTNKNNLNKKSSNKNTGGAKNLKTNKNANTHKKEVGAKNLDKKESVAGAKNINGAKTNENNSKANAKSAMNKPVKKATIKAEGATLSAKDEKKLKAAQIKADRKQKRLEKKLAYKEKVKEREAQLKLKREERKAKAQERKANVEKMSVSERINILKQERLAKIEARNAKREAKLAKIRAEREHKLKARAEKRAERQEKQRAPGFGGWLAAVISLGATTLALGTILTFGWINANGMRANMAGASTQSIYELNSVIDNLDGNLAKARVANSTSDRTKILTNIAIDSEMAEVIMERMPLDCTVTEKTTAFVNKMGETAKEMLYKVASGKELTDNDVKTIDYMYKTNLQIKTALNEMVTNMTEKDILAMIEGKKDCLMLKTFGDLQNNTIEDSKEINDGPFSSQAEKFSAKYLEGLKEVSAPEAEKLCKEYFKNYKVKDAKCAGEASGNRLELYNVSVTLEDDSEMLAQISKKGGKLILFDSYKECNDKKFAVERCVDIAEDFLEELGYDDMEAVWISENGTTCNLKFAYEDDDVIYYPDMIKVKVCEERGIVTGLEALPYVLNHSEREIDKVTVSKADAMKSVSTNIEVLSERIVVISLKDEERLAWEFIGRANDNEYYIYIDAKSGEEIEVYTVISTKQGRALF